ncbi:hypothetical protein BHG40_02415 [Aeromonas salmonicida subsp. masoucida]|nr:hypothetical protein BHG40_02415 [Aeromonas salmonicida subsp. masoucida]
MIWESNQLPVKMSVIKVTKKTWQEAECLLLDLGSRLKHADDQTDDQARYNQYRNHHHHQVNGTTNERHTLLWCHVSLHYQS